MATSNHGTGTAEERQYLMGFKDSDMLENGIIDFENGIEFEQHDDPDVVIPDKIARPLLVSAHLFLVVAIVAACYGRYGLFGVIFVLYLTSIWHWHRPRFSSLARKFDYAAVLASIIYASYIATTLNRKYQLIWFIGLAVIGCIFITNEYLFYIQVMKSFDGKSLDEMGSDGKNAWETKPNTPERDFVYKRTAFVHCIFVHTLAASLALAVIIGSGPVT